MLPLQSLQQFVDEAVLESQQARQIPSHHLAAEIEKLQNQLFDQGQGDAGVIQGFRQRRNTGQIVRATVRGFSFHRRGFGQRRGGAGNIDLNAAAQRARSNRK